MRIRAVLFDATGTLFELRESPGTIYARHAAAFGVTLPAWRLDDAFRRVMKRAGPMVFPGAPPAEIAEREQAWWRAIVRSTFLAADGRAEIRDFDAFFAALYEHFAGAAAWRLRDGAIDALTALRADGLAAGIVSNFDHRLGKVLEALEIVSFFSAVVTPSECGAQKPDPRIFQAALRALGVTAGEALFVGDDPWSDLTAARAIGLQALDVHQLGDLRALPAQLQTVATLPRRA